MQNKGIDMENDRDFSFTWHVKAARIIHCNSVRE